MKVFITLLSLTIALAFADDKIELERKYTTKQYWTKADTTKYTSKEIMIFGLNLYVLVRNIFDFHRVKMFLYIYIYIIYNFVDK